MPSITAYGRVRGRGWKPKWSWKSLEAKEPPVPKAESAGESTAQRTPEDVERVPRVSLSTLLIGCEEPPTGGERNTRKQQKTPTARSSSHSHGHKWKPFKLKVQYAEPASQVEKLSTRLKAALVPPNKT